MAQVKITRNNEGKIMLIDNGATYELIAKKDKEGIIWYPLPKNSANWASIRHRTLEKNGFNLTLEERPAKTISNNNPKTPKEDQILKYLSPEDQKTYLGLLEKAKRAAEIERLKAQIENNKSKLAELEKANLN